MSAVLAASGFRDRDALIASGADTAATRLELDNMLERCWGAVTTVARKLWRDGEVMHSDVLTALGLDEGTAGMGLALIRSGRTPGSFTVTPPLATTAAW